jgi:hypothetical protein
MLCHVPRYKPTEISKELAASVYAAEQNSRGGGGGVEKNWKAQTTR